jgi:hypothetical protein
MVIQYQDWRSPDYRAAEVLLMNSFAALIFAIVAAIVIGGLYWLWRDR